MVTTVFSLTNAHRSGPVNDHNLLGLLISLTLSITVFFAAPISGAALNPARDFGPRLFLITVIGNKDAMTWDALIYIIGPIVGAVSGAYVADRIIIFKGGDSVEQERGKEKKGRGRKSSKERLLLE